MSTVYCDFVKRIMDVGLLSLDLTGGSIIRHIVTKMKDKRKKNKEDNFDYTL